MSNQNEKNRFLDLSLVLTGFTAFELYGTGEFNQYFETITSIVPNDILDELFTTFEKIKGATNDDEEKRNDLIRAKILSDEKLGPVTRNIIKMWFIGTWYKLSNDWRAGYGASEKDETHVVSANAFKEGLLWTSVGSHPPGAKAPGYGTWEQAPKIPSI